MSKASKKLSKSTRTARRGAIARVKGSERLEHRSLMAVDLANPWHNNAFPADVDGDRTFAPRDALVIINSLNTAGARQLFNPAAVSTGGGGVVGEAESPEFRYDVNNDGWVAPVDALRLINLLNGEGEADDLVAFRVKVTNLDGSPLPLQDGKPRVNVGQSVLVQLTTEDTRDVSGTGSPDGVFAAYADLAYGPNLQFERRETQLIRFPSGNPTTPSTGTFTLTVTLPGQTPRTTGPINYVRSSSDPLGVQTRNNIAAALTAQSFGLFSPSEIIVEGPRPGTISKQFNFAVKFSGRFANTDIPEMTATWTGGVTTPPTVISVTQYNQISSIETPPPAVAEDYMSLTYPSVYQNAVTTMQVGDEDPATGTIIDPNVLSELGGVGDIGGVLDGDEYVVAEGQFKVVSAGNFTISTNPADSGQSVLVLLYGSNVGVPVDKIDFGSLDLVAVQSVVAVNDAATVAEDSTAAAAANRINVLANDVLNQGGSKRIVSFASTSANGGAVTLFTNGTTTNLSDDQLIYAPAANFAGTDTFTYVFGDGNGNVATATVTVTVTAVNDRPVNTVPSGTQTTAEDTVRTFSTANSNAFAVTDIDAAANEIRVTFTATNGTLGLTNAAGVTATGNGASSTPLEITGTVANINTALGLGLNFTPTANFSGSGTIVMATTDQGNTGSGGALTDTDTITVTITAVNDAPVNTLPATLATDEGVAFTIAGLSIADVDAGTAQVRTTLSVTANTGVLQLLTTTGVTVTTNNSASVQITGTLAAINTALNGGVRFTPAAGFAGDSQFTMLTTDQGASGSGGALTDTDSVTLQVRPLVRPRASSDTLTVAEDSSGESASNQLNVFTNDVPNPGATLTVVGFTQPANGSVTQVGATGTFKFTPAADFAGSTTFTYTVNDTAGTGANSTATVTVNVTAINDAPTAVADSASVAEDTVGTITAASLTVNDSKGGGADETSQTLTITAAAVVSGGGTVQVSNGNVVYTPAANYAGPATLTYTIRDNGQTNGVNDFKEATGTITVEVTEVNDAPMATNDSGFTVAEDGGPLLIALADLVSNDSKGGGADESGQTLSITSVTGVTSNAGSVTISGANVQYTPAADYNGTFIFTYVVTDNGTTNKVADPKTATGTVTVTVTEVNDAPTATNDTVIGVLATPTNYTSVQLTANDLRGPANEFGQSLKVTAVSSPSTNGATVTVDANGVVTYTPATGAVSGTSDTFTYTVTDNGTTNGSADPKTATGTVTVNIVNFRPMTISGFVYLDFDNDGVKDAGEVGLGHIDVTLTGTDFGGTTIAPQTIITNRDGLYEFTNLAPGNYTITQGQASNAIDGLETAGSPQLSSPGNDRFSFNITLDANVQLQTTTFANNNFGERGLSSNYVSIHLLIVPGVPGVPGTSPLPEGLLFSFNDANATNLDWYAIEDGWNGVSYSGVTLSADRMSANIRVVNAQGQNVQTTATVASGRLRIQQDAAGRAVAYVIGSYGDFNWLAAQSGGGGEGEGEGEAALVNEALAGSGDAEYVAAIDAALGEVWG